MAHTLKSMKEKTDIINDVSPEIILKETTVAGVNIDFDNIYETRTAYQTVLSGKDRVAISILVFGYNNLQKHTQYCVESILKYTTDIDYELVLLDNGSSDGTFEYFKSVPYKKKKIVRVTHNQGANFGVHVGIPYLTGHYVIMIANDVYVTKNWLVNLIRCAESDHRIGFIASASDNISNLQAVNLTFANLDEMRLKAEQYNVSDPRKWEERLRLMPAIAFIRRECLDIVGSLDYVFQHDFSDDDVSIRIRRAGYKLVFCGDVFVHHAGASVTGATTKQKIDLLNTGRAIFRQKYYGIDAWDDINNFELLMLNLVNPEEMRGKSKPRVLGIDVRCGTPILQLKNKLRLADIFDTELSAFVQDPKYWLDLKTICEGKVVVDRIEFLSEHFSPNSFDYILLGNPLNSYPGSDKILRDIMSLLKSEGQLLIKLRNHFDPHVFLESAGKDYPNSNKSVSYSDIDNLNQVLMQHGYAVKDIRLSLQPLDDATKEAVRAVIKQTCTDDKIEATFRELTAEEYALRVINNGNVQPEALNDEIHELPQQKATTPTAEDPLSCRFSHAAVVPGLTSIVVLTHNQLDQTKKCLKSIRKFTPDSHEIIFVDNASTDGTRKWLQAQVKDNKNYSLVENKEKGGYAARINQGITRAQGEYILLLSQSVVVGPDWLKGMTACLNTAPDAGIVSPMTNQDEGIQQIADEGYCALDSLEKYALVFRERHLHRRIPSWNLSGFCLLFSRKLIEEVGCLDEGFSSAEYIAEDFCLRSVLNGYANYVAGDVFVHRHGTRRSLGDKDDYSLQVSRDRRFFNRKWVPDFQIEVGKKLSLLKIMDLAADLYQRGKLDQAVHALVAGIKIIPDSKDVYANMVRMFLESKHFPEAWAVCESMPDNVKRDIRGMECAGYAKEGLGMDAEAADFADRMLAIDESYAPALNLKGIIAYKTGDGENALEYFKKAMEADPGYSEAYTNLGVLCWAMDQKEDGLAYLRKGFILSATVPDSGSTYYSVGSSLGMFEDMEIDFREATGLYPGNRYLLFLYIDILIQLGRLDSAMDKIEDALAVFGLDDGILNAALAVREQVGLREIKKHGNKSSLSLCMIVKNEERHLTRCLRSVRDIVDEIIIVDTGSTDKTIDIARVFGAKVYEFPWTGNFSAARNESLIHASGDWILVLDADEVISAPDQKRLLQTISACKQRSVAFDFMTRNYVGIAATAKWKENDGSYPDEERGSGWFGSNKVRLFRNIGHIRFENPVHELVEPCLIRARIPIENSNIPIHHYGRLDQEKLAEKGEAYYLLGRRKLEERGGNDQTALRELAVQAGEIGRYEEAIDLWQQLLTLCPDNIDALNNLPSSYIRLGKYQEAFGAAKRAFEISAKAKDGLLNYALCEMLVGNIRKTRLLIEEAITEDVETMNPILVMLLGAARLIEGDQDQGNALFKELSEKNQLPTVYLLSLLEHLFNSGQYEYFRRLVDPVLAGGIMNPETLRFHMAPILNKTARCLQTEKKEQPAMQIVNLAIESTLADEETRRIRDSLLAELPA